MAGVAQALLEASRRMSVGTRPTLVIHPTVGGTGEPLSPTGSTPGLSASTDSTGSPNGWFGGSHWNSSTSELDDKLDDKLPTYDGGWFGAKRVRTYSESDGPRVKIDVMSWLSGTPRPIEASKTRKFSEPINRRIRRHSTQEVEEAMAGGLNKADIYMPPF